MHMYVYIIYIDPQTPKPPQNSFLRTEEPAEGQPPEVITDMSQVHAVGTLAQVCLWREGRGDIYVYIYYIKIFFLMCVRVYINVYV